jgi:hypothetical protein
MSLLPYVNKTKRKDEENRQFRYNFQHVRKAITLSKLRRLKYDMVEFFIKKPTMTKEYFDAMYQQEIDLHQQYSQENLNQNLF